MTSDRIVLPPNPVVCQCADVLDEAVGDFLRARDTVLGGIGRYEADREAMLLTNLIVRHIEAAILLARHDLVLFPTACVVSRSAIETSARAIWLLTPDDPFERECRWLAHFASEIEAYERSNRMVKIARFDTRLKQLMEFHARVKAALPDGYEVPKRVPNFRRMLEEIGRPEAYLMYIQLSQYSHGAHMATGTYRKHLERASGGPSSFPSPDLQKRAKEISKLFK